MPISMQKINGLLLCCSSSNLESNHKIIPKNIHRARSRKINAMKSTAKLTQKVVKKVNNGCISSKELIKIHKKHRHYQPDLRKIAIHNSMLKSEILKEISDINNSVGNQTPLNNYSKLSLKELVRLTKQPSYILYISRNKNKKRVSNFFISIKDWFQNKVRYLWR